MATTTSSTVAGANGSATKRGAKVRLNGQASGGVKSWRDGSRDKKTDYTRWRLEDDRGCQIWHYLESDEECEKWPQSVADKWFLGLPTVSMPALFFARPRFLS
jgi:lanosterol synthase